MSGPLLNPLDTSHAESIGKELGLWDAMISMNVFRTAMHNPGVARCAATLVEQIAMAGALDPRLRELVVLRVTWLANGKYEWSKHYPYAQTVGATPAELADVRDPANSRSLSEGDLFVLGIVDELMAHRTPSENDVKRLRELLGDAGLVELLVLPGFYAALAALTRTLRIELDEGGEVWAPDGMAPAEYATERR